MFVFSKDVKNIIKFKPKEVYVDNTVFRCHYVLTFSLLMIFTVLVCTRQYIGEHINCIASESLAHVINTYCFFMTTYTVVKHHNASSVQTAVVPHPGVGHHTEDDQTIRHAYYQWVPFVLFGQALCFYFPHILWKAFEKGRVKRLATGMKGLWLTASKENIKVNDKEIPSAETKSKKVDGLRKNFFSLMRLRVNKDWAKSLCFCELLNVANVVLQIYVTDAFLDGKFLTLGHEWTSTTDKTSLLDEVFPKVTKCTFNKYGASGTLQKHDALCIMALNIVNEKIYCILWFWFLILFGVTVLGLLWRAVTFLFHSNPGFSTLVWLQINPGPPLNSMDVATLSYTLTFSDWLFFYYVGKNIDGNLFRTFLSGLAEDVRNGDSPISGNSLPPPTPPHYARTAPRLMFADDEKSNLLKVDEPDYPGEESHC